MVRGLGQGLFTGGIVGGGDATKGAAIAMYIGALLEMVARIPVNLAIFALLSGENCFHRVIRGDSQKSM
jgi:hypothetical protein